MATSKVNIFNSLPQHASDSEDDDFQTKGKKVTGQNRTKTDDKKAVKKTDAPKQQKEEQTHQKDARKPKGVSEQPHPLDRHSGTGTSAYGAKPKKGGAGKGNWGKTTEEKEAGNEEAGDESPEKVEEEEKPEGITLQEYLSSQRRVESQPQVNQAKASITSEQLIKELGKSTLLKSKNTKTVDDHRVGKKKERLDVNHKAGIATEFADLLGFRTGFVDKEYKPREKGEREEGQRRGPRTEGNRRREDAKEEEKPATEATATTTTEGQTQEGEQPATTEEGQTRRNEGQRDNRRGGNRGGYKQGNRGDKPQGDRPRGDRPQGGRRPQDPKINIEDESAFPKLG